MASVGHTVDIVSCFRGEGGGCRGGSASKDVYPKWVFGREERGHRNKKFLGAHRILNGGAVKFANCCMTMDINN